MNDGSFNEKIFLKNIPNNFKTIPFFLIWQSYIQECFKLYKLSMRTKVWGEFISTISKQYFQEIDCLELKIPNYQSNLWQTIRFRSCSPLWVNFLINFLSNDTNLKFYSQKLREIILKLGKVAKIIDDINDLNDDLSNRRWNYILIKTREKYPSIFNKINKIDDFGIIQLIINNGIIDESIYEACNTYHNAIANLKNMGLCTDEFEQYMKLFFSNWYK
ncbi:hypothetical protein AYK24_04625 [Thermoplasmatales archaeon SG8-52-4]|nr:MAG: hypothetical protein AYK24_04625 [Thermoplasmatales archaeon SG8-52-4]